MSATIKLSLKNWHDCDLSHMSGRLLYFTRVSAPWNSFYTYSTIKAFNEEAKATASQADSNGNLTLRTD